MGIALPLPAVCKSSYAVLSCPVSHFGVLPIGSYRSYNLDPIELLLLGVVKRPEYNFLSILGLVSTPSSFTSCNWLLGIPAGTGKPQTRRYRLTTLGVIGLRAKFHVTVSFDICLVKQAHLFRALQLATFTPGNFPESVRKFLGGTFSDSTCLRNLEKAEVRALWRRCAIIGEGLLWTQNASSQVILRTLAARLQLPS